MRRDCISRSTGPDRGNIESGGFYPPERQGCATREVPVRGAGRTGFSVDGPVRTRECDGRCTRLAR